MSNPRDMIEYNQGLRNTIQELFINRIVPSNFIYLIHKHDPNVLTDSDVRRVVKSIESKIDMDVNMELLDLMSRYKGWFKCLLNVLGDPALKQDDLIQHFKNLKDRFNKKWRTEKGGAERLLNFQSYDCRRGMKDNRNRRYGSVPLRGVPESGGQPAVANESVSNGSFAQAAAINEAGVQFQQNKAEFKIRYNEGGDKVISDSPKKEHVARPKIIKYSNKPLVKSASVSNLNAFQTAKLERVGEKAGCPLPQLQDGHRSPFFCGLCREILKTPQIAEAHYSGEKHQKKFEEKELDTSAQAQTSNTGQGAAAAGVAVHRLEDETLQADAVFSANQIYTLNEKGQGMCHLCGVALTSLRLADAHLKGKGHRKKLETLHPSIAK